MPALTFGSNEVDDDDDQTDAFEQLVESKKPKPPSTTLNSAGLRSVRVKDTDPLVATPLEKAPEGFEQTIGEHFRGTVFESALQRTFMSLKQSSNAKQVPLFSLFNFYLVDELLQLSQVHNQSSLSGLTADSKRYLFPLVSARRAAAFDSKVAGGIVTDYLNYVWLPELTGKDMKGVVKHVASPAKTAHSGGRTREKLKTYFAPANWFKLNGPIVHVALGVGAGFWFPPLLLLTVPGALLFGISRTKVKPQASQGKEGSESAGNFLKKLITEQLKAAQARDKVAVGNEAAASEWHHDPALLMDALYTFTKHNPEQEDQTVENFIKLTRSAFAFADKDQAEQLPQEFLKTAVHLETIRASLHKLFNPGNDISKRGFAQTNDVERYEAKLDRLYHSPEKNQVRMDKRTYETIQGLISRLRGTDIASKASVGNVTEQVRTIVDKLPWTIAETKPLTPQSVKAALDEQLSGMDKVKQEIIRNVVSLDHTQRTRDAGEKSKIVGICLVGPPGTGKTSLGQAIATASGRPFVIKKLGGISDPNALKGFSPTYVGSKNGLIVDGLIQAKALNPVFMLDEIDKLGESQQFGSPKSVLMEVLDPDYNNEFQDNFLGIPTDLSKSLFICTANKIDEIPEALRSRLLMIQVPGYSSQDKLKIANEKIIPKICQNTGLTIEDLKKRGLNANTSSNAPLLTIEENALKEIIDNYASVEGGVRDLEKALTEIAQNIIQKLTSGDLESIPVITKNNYKKFINRKIIELDKIFDGSYIGFINGLGFSPNSGFGGALPIQAVVTKTKSKKTKFELGFEKASTGNIMKAANGAVLSFLRKNQSLLIDQAKPYEYRFDLLSGDVDVSADGPSAGLATALVFISALKQKPINSKITITGGMDFIGRAQTIGGIREKINGAYRDGCRTFMVPAGRNYEEALEDVPPEILKDIKLIPINTIVDAMEVIWGKDDKLVRAFRKDKELSQLQASLDKQRPKYPPELAQKHLA